MIMLADDDGTYKISSSANKIFYSETSYTLTKANYNSYKQVLPNMVSEWGFDDANLTIYFPRLPGDCLVNQNEETCTRKRSFFDTEVQVVNVSHLGYRPIKDGHYIHKICPLVLQSNNALFNLIQSCMVQRILGIGDVGPRNHLVTPHSTADGPMRLYAIDMSDRGPQNISGENFVDKLFSHTTGRDCPLRHAINKLLTESHADRKREMHRSLDDLSQRAIASSVYFGRGIADSLMASVTEMLFA